MVGLREGLGERGAGSWRLSLRASLIGLLLLVLVPTLAVVALTLLHAGRSYRDASTGQLLETGHIVTQSVESELEAMARLLATHASSGRLPAWGTTDPLRGGVPVFDGRAGTTVVSLASVDANVKMLGPVASLALQAAKTGRLAVSNIVNLDIDGAVAPHIVVSMPYAVRGQLVDVVTFVAHPAKMVRTLAHRDGLADTMVLAVADGEGHIVGRSHDPEKFIGKPVPDWQSLKALGTSNGIFEARTLEGPKVIFAFQSIDGTPGWVAVVGEPLAVFNARWQQPLYVMIGASAATLILALLLAALLARQILRPIKQLAQHARTVAEDKALGSAIPATVPYSFISEFETLRQSLDEAESALRQSLEAERTTAQALASSERRYRAVAQASALGFWTRDPSGVLTSASGFDLLAGIADDKALGDGWQQAIHPDDLAKVDEAWTMAMGRQGPLDVEFRVRSNGGWRWVRSRAAPVLSDDGKLVEWFGVLEDVTARKAAEEDLRLQRERLALATEAANLGVWEYNPAAGLIVTDARWRQIFGIDSAPAESSMETFTSHVHPDDVEREGATRQAALNSGTRNYRVDFRIIRPDGETRWLSSSACLIEPSALTSRRLVGVVMDVTEQHLAGQKLQESYEALRQAERLARIGSWTLDLKTGHFASSDMLWELNGFDPDGPPVTMARLQEAMTPKSLEKINAAVARCIEDGTPYDVEIEHLRPDGSTFAADVRGKANRDRSGRIVSISGTVQDISQQQEERARIAALADNLPNGAIYRLEYDRRGGYKLTYYSAGIETLIGVPAAEIMADREAFLHAIHEDDRDWYQTEVRRSLESAAVFDCRFRARHRDGRVVWMHCRSAPRTLSDGTTVWDGIMRDVTEEHLVAEALKSAKETAEAAERTKSDFLATMSHEIRTPMNTVIGMTRLTLQTELAPKQRNYLEKIDASAKTLLGIINDVLDFSKIEAGNLELEDVAFDLDSVLESVSAVTAMRAEEKGLEIAYAIDATTPRRLRGDPLRLAQVLTNLVSNAVKFTEAGEVVVEVEPASGEDGTAMLRFAVRDTGIGLDAEQIAGLFRPFTQADKETSRKYGGTGLGLAICRQLVEMMGGTISVESTPGEGSLFTFTIVAKAVGAANSPVPHRVPQLAGRHVLIVDDNASARQILGSMMAEFGMLAETVPSGEEALSTLRAKAAEGAPFDLVLMDWRMPSMDGLETARRIRMEEDLPFIPAVLMVTAYGREEVLRRAEQLGLQGVLIKPITESVMFNTVLDILSLPGPRAKMEHDAAPERPESGQAFAVLGGRRILVVDDNALNREVASDFLTTAGMRVETAVDGRDAIDMLERSDFDAVLMDMHMPRLDGLSAAREIRRHARWAGLPIIALTAQARLEDRQASLDAGMTAHLTKPIDEMALYRTLAVVLAPAGTANRENGHGPEPAGGQGARGLSGPLSDRIVAAALRRFGDERSRVLRLLKGFQRDVADAPERLDRHLSTGDIAAVAALAHTTKGSAGYFDAHDFCLSAELLEQAARQGEIEEIAERSLVFRTRLEELLAAVAAALVDLSNGNRPSGGNDDVASILNLIARALPLIARGDYSAQDLLNRIKSGLRHGPDQKAAGIVQAYYDDLELEAAEAALRQLKARLEATSEKTHILA